MEFGQFVFERSDVGLSGGIRLQPDGCLRTVSAVLWAVVGRLLGGVGPEASDASRSTQQGFLNTENYHHEKTTGRNPERGPEVSIWPPIELGC